MRFQNLNKVSWKVDGKPSLHIGLFFDPLLINLPFGICAIYFDLKVMAIITKVTLATPNELTFLICWDLYVRNHSILPSWDGGSAAASHFRSTHLGKYIPWDPKNPWKNKGFGHLNLPGYLPETPLKMEVRGAHGMYITCFVCTYIYICMFKLIHCVQTHVYTYT